MKHGITGIDHPVIAVRDLDGARKTYERLGFTIPPRGRHPLWGTGNLCIMFENDYLELRGVIDSSEYTKKLEAFLDTREGLMGTALGTDNAKATFESLTTSGVDPNPVHELTRSFELPEGTEEVRFALSFLKEEDSPGLMNVVLCQHLSPEKIRRPEWLQHANGVMGVHSLTSVVSEIDRTELAMQRLFGASNVNRIDNSLTARTSPDSYIEFLRPSDIGARLGSTTPSPPPHPPYLACVTLTVQDLAKSQSYLKSVGVDSVPGPKESLLLNPKDTCGVSLELVDGLD